MRILSIAFVLVVSAVLGGCQEPTTMVVRKHADRLEDPVALDAEHVEENAPALYGLLEEAKRTGHAGTRDRADWNEIWGYLRDLTGTNENNFFLEYKGGYYGLGLATA